MVLKRGKSEVTFIYRPEDRCQRVELAGTFNGWQPEACRMTRQKDGSFRKRVQLTPGEYRYRFLVDGRWMTDPEAERVVPNPYGSTDALLVV